MPAMGEAGIEILRRSPVEQLLEERVAYDWLRSAHLDRQSHPADAINCRLVRSRALILPYSEISVAFMRLLRRAF